MKKNTISIAIAIPLQLYRKGLAEQFSKFDELNIVLQTENCATLIQKQDADSAQITIVDMDYLAKTTNEQKAFYQLSPNTKVLGLTLQKYPEHILHWIQEGMHGIVDKNSSSELIYNAVYKVHYIGFHICENIARTLGSRRINDRYSAVFTDPKIKLSAREKEILGLICREFTSGEIAEKLSLSKRTVDGHRTRLIEKLGVRNTAGLVLYAVSLHKKNNPISDSF